LEDRKNGCSSQVIAAGKYEGDIEHKFKLYLTSPTVITSPGKYQIPIPESWKPTLVQARFVGYRHYRFRSNTNPTSPDFTLTEKS
jgi:hypothetical protein